jgi:mevalonate kinase
LLDSGIVGETAPMVTIFMENLKDKGFHHVENQFVNILMLASRIFLVGT